MEERLPRKLTVILHADVVGYSRLAGEDEDATHHRLKESLELITNLVSSYHGHIVNTAGDAVLAVFDAVVDAVSCAVAIQHNLSTLNRGTPDSSKVLFRIGVNLGDVIEDGGDIYGDGVNVAARLEGLAEPGGICISEQVFLAVGSKLALDYQDIGAQAVKNIAEPVQAYRMQLQPGAELPPPSERHKSVNIYKARRQFLVAALVITLVITGGMLAWLKPWQPEIEPASMDRMAFPLPDKASVAVLPFNNLSGDPEKDYFVDGFTEDIIIGLSRFSELFVIAKPSTFTYKNNDASIAQVSEELGVRYVLNGSVRMTEADLLLTAQLIDATSGKIIWAERYEKPLHEFHTIQSDVLNKIVSTVAERLENIGLRIAARKQTEKFSAYDHVLKGYDLVFRWNKDSNEQARMHFEQAIELDPLYARAYAGLAFTHNIDFGRSWSSDREQSLVEAKEASLKAISLDDSDNRPYVTLGWAYINGGQYDKGVAELNKGISLNPNDAGVLARSGYALTYYGEFQQAINQAKRAMRINPFHPNYYYDVLAWAQYFLQLYDDALRTLSHITEPNMAQRRTLAATYARLGKIDRAQHHAEKILELDPDFTLSKYAKTQPFKNPEHLKFHLESLRLAGLPDNPPLEVPDKPSIAVLPFTNMSGHPEQEYFADGMAEDLITDLSKLSGLFVISRNSSFNFKGKSISIKQVAKELGVRYVLEGSVRRDGDQVRINAQLIDASDEGHLWADRYDGSLENIFSFQDSITAQIVSALKVNLLDSESILHSDHKTYNVAAHDAYLRGLEAYYRDTPKDNGAAAQHLINAIEIDPGYSAAYTALAKVYARGSLRNFKYKEALGMSLSQLITNLLEVLGNPAVTPDADYHAIRSLLMLRKRQFTEAIAEAKRSLVVSPNNVDALEALAEALIFYGELEEGVKVADLAIRQSPSLNSRLIYLKGVASYVEGDLSSSISLIEQAIKQSPKSEFNAVLAAAYQEQGLSEAARSAMESYAPTLHNFDMTWPNLGEATQHYPFNDRNVLARFASSLAKAGATDTGYTPLVSSNRLNATEVRDLLFGSSIRGVRFWWYDSFTQSRDEEGVSSHPGRSILTGRYGDTTSVSRFIGDSLCEYYSGIGDVCVSIFKMPEKDSLHTRRGDYVMVTDFGPAPFRVQ